MQLIHSVVVSFSTVPSLKIKVGNIDCKLFENNNTGLIKTLQFGNMSFNSSVNSKSLYATIDFERSTKRFDLALF